MKLSSFLLITVLPMLSLLATENEPAPNPAEAYKNAVELMNSKDTPGNAQMAIAFLVSAASAGDAEAAKARRIVALE